MFSILLNSASFLAFACFGAGIGALGKAMFGGWLAISAFYVGTAQARADGAAAARRLLAERRAPASDIARIERNAAYYE